MTTDELADLLTGLAAAVRAGDSLEGSLEYLLPGPDEKHHGDMMHGGCPHVMVTAAFRVGNRQGQGGMRFVGEHQDAPDAAGPAAGVPAAGVPAATKVEYGVRAAGHIAQLYGELRGALCCAARYHHQYGYRTSIEQRDVTEWRELAVPDGTVVPRVVTCRHNPEPHVLDDDKDDDGGCVDVVDVELPPAVAAALPHARCGCCQRRVRPLDGDGRCGHCGLNRSARSHDGDKPCAPAHASR